MRTITGPERAEHSGAPHVHGIEPRDGGLELRLRLLLASGGDERIWPDPVTGRNRYGDHHTPSPRRDLVLLLDGQHHHRARLPRGPGRSPGPARRRSVRTSLQVQDWLCGLRAELLALYGRPGAEAVLAASGTDAELIALAIAERLLGASDHQHRRRPQRDRQRRGQGRSRAEFPGHLLPGRPGARRAAPRRLGRCRYRGRLRRHPHAATASRAIRPPWTWTSRPTPSGRWRAAAGCCCTCSTPPRPASPALRAQSPRRSPHPPPSGCL